VWFLGVDLAWGFRRPSWVCILEREKKCLWREFFSFVTLREWEEYLRALPPGSIVAFDAPLLVTVEKGLRAAEKELLPWLRQRHSGILPINLSIARRRYPALFPFWESVRRNFSLSLDFSKENWHALEVFPPLSILGFFGNTGLALYRFGRLRELGELFRGEGSPLHIENLGECLSACLCPSPGKKDRFDAFICACTALFAGQYGKDALRTFGNGESFIVLPSWVGELS
jgi:predicted RNase H-like nuclease